MRAGSTNRKEIWIYFALSALLMCAGFVVGLTHHEAFQHQLAPMLHALSQTAQHVKASGGWVHAFEFIFLHNAITALELALFGLVIGLFPAYMMWLNGLVVGYAVAVVSTTNPGAQDWKTIVLGLLPHGVFELTAIFWASALGIANGMAVLRAIKQRIPKWSVEKETSTTARDADADDVQHPLRSALWRTFRTLPLIWGILVIAAIIEAAITPHLLSWGMPNLSPV